MPTSISSPTSIAARRAPPRRSRTSPSASGTWPTCRRGPTSAACASSSPRWSGGWSSCPRSSRTSVAPDLLTRVGRDLERSALRARNGLRYVRGTHRPALGATPRDVVWKRDKAQLWRYRGTAPLRCAQPLLIVTSLVSRSYILDLLPGSSSVEFLRAQGFDVYLLDWGVPDHLDAENRLETYVDEYLPRAVDAMLRESGTAELTMVGYCLGGVLAALYAAGHEDERVRNLVLLATPVDFSAMGPMVAALQEGRLGPDDIVDESGNVPADVLYSGFFMMAPTTVVAQNATLLQHLWNDEFVA